MTIGIPKALLYHRYKTLWETFFRTLGCETVTSPDTNKQILETGIKYSIDESCVPSKIFMGHVHELVGKCDYILVPRFVSYGKNSDVCVKFYALYDIVKNTFRGTKLIDYNIDNKDGFTERQGFIKMGKKLGFSKKKSLEAYVYAKNKMIQNEIDKIEYQNNILSNTTKQKILIISHSYNIYDKLFGQPVVDILRKLDAVPIYADIADKRTCIEKSMHFSRSLHWLYNKELIGAMMLLENKIDGIILFSSFPCGPDSLVNELILRKQANKPIINIIFDELHSETGLQTRLESFLDIITLKEGAVIS